MSTSTALLHPVRLRIVQILDAGGELTPKQLHEQLSDVPIATLYRHIAQLASLGIIEVVGERQIRGASEKTYRLVPALAKVDPEELAALSRDELLTAFTVFTSGLIEMFRGYLNAEHIDVMADQVGFAQVSFWASDEELNAFGQALASELAVLHANEPGEGRRRRLFATVSVPTSAGGQP